MRWFLVSYNFNPLGDRPHDFACVLAWNRREAYFEVINDLTAAAKDRQPFVRFYWDANLIH